MTFKMLENRDQVDEDQYQCYYCTDFTYVSMILCKTHKINYCLYHQFMCGCQGNQLEVVYRYSTQELEKFEEKIV